MGASIDGFKNWWYKSYVEETERNKARIEQSNAIIDKARDRNTVYSMDSSSSQNPFRGLGYGISEVSIVSEDPNLMEEEKKPEVKPDPIKKRISIKFGK